MAKKAMTLRQWINEMPSKEVKFLEKDLASVEIDLRDVVEDYTMVRFIRSLIRALREQRFYCKDTADRLWKIYKFIETSDPQYGDRQGEGTEMSRQRRKKFKRAHLKKMKVNPWLE